MPYLLSISIGPVQGFITSARRFRDLWFGSWLLVELSKAAAAAIAEEEGLNALIFPAPERFDQLAPDSGFLIANKLLARIEGNPESVAQKAEQAVRNRLAEVRDEAFRRIKQALGSRTDRFDEETAIRQVDDLLEWQWAAVPLTTYAASRTRVEALLAARKNTREFAPVSWGSDRPKSSLDGQREAVLLLDGLSSSELEHLRLALGLRQGENLCGVGLLKRLGADRQAEGIPSTSALAAQTSLHQKGERAKDAEKHYRQALSGFPRVKTDRPLDGQWFFEERLEELVGSDRLDQAKIALQKFRSESGIHTTFPYYVILNADGDQMGKTLDAMQSPEDHRRFSQALAGFAIKAREIVEDREGTLIYAGGDDVFALLPMYSSLACARELSDAFRESLRSFGQGPTLSVGLAVGHHLDPAGELRTLVQRAEREAKRTRNALGIIVNKRSGSELPVSGPWGAFDTRLETWIDLLKHDLLPDGAAYELRHLATIMSDPDLAEAQCVETKRILKRKRDQGGELISEEVLRCLIEPLSKTYSPKDLADELIASRLFAEAR